MLSIVMPAHNEEGSIEETIKVFNKVLKEEKIAHEILVVNNGSSDNTEKLLLQLEKDLKELRHINEPRKGYGLAVIKGVENFNYPRHKLILNRLGNVAIKILFGIKYNDTSNAFKIYKKETIEGLKPFISKQFNLTI